VDFNPVAFLELFIVLGFALGWGILELVGLRLDRKRAEEKARAAAASTESESAR
jgi:hypothetical protein